MYKTPVMHKTLISVNNTTEGETIEEKVVRIMANKEPIKDGAPIIYTDRKDGVNPAYNVRTDRWEIAVDAMDKIRKSKEAKTDGLAKAPEQDGKIIEMDSKTKSTQGEAS